MLSRAQYLEYLQEYAHCFKLTPMIKLNHAVKKVHYLPYLEPAEREEWKNKVGSLKKFFVEIVTKS